MAVLIPTTLVIISGGQVQSRSISQIPSLTEWLVVSLDLNGEWVLADNSTAILAGQRGLAIVRDTTATGIPVAVFDSSSLMDLGVTEAATDEIVLSSTPGRMAPKADLLSTQFYTTFGYMRTTTQLQFRPNATGIAKA